MPSSDNQAGRTEPKLKAVREAAFSHLLTATLQHNEALPERNSCPGASREEQQILGAQVFPIPAKHGSRNGPHKAGDSPHHRQNRDNVDNNTTGRASYVPIAQPDVSNGCKFTLYTLQEFAPS